MTSSIAQTPQTPAAGSAERIAILDAARVPATQELGKSIQFRVDQLNVLDGWAFVRAAMLDADGKPLSYTGTRYAEAAAHGMKSRSYVALLHAGSAGWNVVAHSVGPTDVAWEGWSREFAAPAALFVLHER